MFEVYCGNDLVFTGNHEEVARYCELNNSWDTGIDTHMAEIEYMLASRYEYDTH